MGGLSSLWQDTWDNVSDWAKDIEDFAFHGGFEDDLVEAGRWFDDEVWEPVYEFQKDVVNGILDDPIKFATDAILIATGQGWVIPLMNGAAVIDAGGDWEDVLKSVAVGYSAQYLGAKTSGFAPELYAEYVPDQYYNDVVAASLMEGTERGVNALVLGESGTDAFVGGVLSVSTQELAGIALGEIDERIGLAFKDLEGRNYPLPQAAINVISAGLTAELQGEEITPALYAEAVSKALITTEAVSSVLGKVPEVITGDISDRQLSFLTTSIQRTATVALAGGTGDDAARVLLETIKGFGAEELNKAIEDSLLGDVLDNALDVLTGDFGAVSDTVDALGNLWTGSIEGLQNQATAIADTLDEYGRKYNISLENWNEPRFMTGSGSNTTEYSFAELGANAQVPGWTWKRGTSGYKDSGDINRRNEMVFNPDGGGQTFTEALYASEVQKLKDSGNSYYHGSDGDSRAKRDAAEYSLPIIFNNEIAGEDRSWWRQHPSYSDKMWNGKEGDGNRSMTKSDWQRAQDFYNNRSISALSGDLNETYGDYNGYLEDSRTTLENLNTQLTPLYAQWDQLNLDLTDYLSDLETSSEEVNTNFSPINDEISEVFVTAMDPNFVLGEYAEINNIPLEDGYDHYLSMGSKAGLATNNAAAAVMEEKEEFDTVAQILGEVTVYADKPSNNNTLMFSQTYFDLIKGKEGQPAVPKEVVESHINLTSLDKLLANEDKAGTVEYYANAYAKRAADVNMKTQVDNYTGELSKASYEKFYKETYYADDLAYYSNDWKNSYGRYSDQISWQGDAFSDGSNYAMDKFALYTYPDGTVLRQNGWMRQEYVNRNYYSDIPNEYKDVDFTNLDRAANEDFSGEPTILSGDTSWSDVIAGNADKRFNVVTNEFEWVKKAEDAAPVTIWDANKGIVPINTGATDFVTLRSEDPIDFVNNLIEMNEVIITAEREEINASFTANGMAGYLDMAMWIGAKREEIEQSVLDAIPGSQARKDAFEDDVANLVEWGAGMVNTVNGVQRFIGMDVNPEVTEWANKWQKLGAEMHTQGYKDARAENDAIMAAPIPEGMGNAEGTARKILGTLENRPSVFLMDMVGGEVFQEGLPWLVGAGAVALAAPAVAAAGLSAAAGAAIVAGVGLTAALGTEVLLAMSETFDGAYEKVYQESVAELSKQTYTTYINDVPQVLPMYQPAEIEELSRKMADDLAFKNSLTAGILTTISMGFGGAKLEKFLFGNKGNASFTSATEELMDRVDTGAVVIASELVSETAEEVLTTAHLGSLIVANVNQDYDVAPDVWMSAFLSPIISTGTVGTIYTLGQGPLATYNTEVNYDLDGVTQGDGFSMRDSFNGTTTNMSADPNTHLLLASSPQVNWAFNNTPKTVEGAQQLELFLDDVGVEGTTAVNLLNEAWDSGYQSSAEVVEEFAKAGYTPTIEEITQFTSSRGTQNRIEYTIPQYVEPFVVTAQDLVDAAAGKGVTLTLDQASEMKSYLGQYVEDDKATAITARAEPVADLAVLDADEVSELFQANGWTKEQADNYVAANPNIAASVVGMTESEVQNLYGSLIDAEVVTREEAEAFYAEHYPGYAFTPEDIDAIVTGANVTWGGSAGESAAIQTIKDQEYNSAENTQARAAALLAAQKTASLAELDGILSDKNSDIYNQYVTNINNASAGDSLLNLTSLRNDAGRFELTQQELEDALHDQLGIARDTSSAVWEGGKLRYRKIDNGMDAAVAAALASGITVGTNPTAKDDLLGGYTTGVKRDTTESAFGDYNPSEQEITDFLNNNAGIDNYVDANTVTEAEVQSALEAAGFTIPANFDYTPFTGKKPESDLGAATQSWQDANTVTEAEVQSALEAAGFTVPADFDYTPFTGKNKADSGINNATQSWQDANSITEAEVESALLAEGFTVPADFDYSAFTGKNKAESGLEATAKTYADENTVTEAEVRKSLIDQGFTVPTDFDYTPFVGQKPESGLNNATKSWRDANTVTEAEVKSALEADGFTVPAEFDYTPFTGKYDQTGLSAKTANWREANTITEAEVKARLAIQGFNVPADFDYSAFTGKKPESGLDAATESWRNENTTTEAEAIASLQGQGYVIPEGFDVTQFTGKNKDSADLATEVYQYLSPLQYTRGDAEAALATELGRALTADDLVTYKNYLDGMVDMTGARTNAQGDLQVQEQITNAADVKSYLDGLDYDTSGLTNEDLLAFAGTGLGIDLGTATADYQTDNETITQRDARLAAEAAAAAELEAKTTAINAAMDDASQDGGAYSGVAYDGIRDYYLYNVKGKPQYDALDEEGRKALVQRAVDNRRYSESEIAADIRTAFPADADLSVEDLKTKYGTLFTTLQTEGNYGHEDSQRIAFDQGTITGDEANDYFRDVLGYEGWIPTGNIDSRLVGAGDEATVLPTDIANLTGKTLDLYNETTITTDEVIGAMIANPAGFGFADAAAVGEAVSNGLDLSAYTGNYWQSGAEGSAGDTGKSLAARLDDATISQDEIDAYLAQEGFDPADAGTFDGNLGFDTTSLADITAGYRGGVEAEREVARVEEAAKQRIRDDIIAAIGDNTQDGGAFNGSAAYVEHFIDNHRAEFDNLDAAGIKTRIQNDIDRRRYTRVEVANDIRTAFPADAGLSVEDLMTKYPTLFDLAGEGNHLHESVQEAAFDQGSITDQEVQDYFKDVLGYDGWMPTGSITSRIAGVGDESTVLPTDTANLTGETLALYNETTITTDEVIGAMLANPAGFGFADVAAVGEAVSNGLDLSAYTGNYWQAGANPNQVIPQDKANGLLDRLDGATVSEAEINAYLQGEGFAVPNTSDIFGGSLGFNADTPESITATYRNENEVTYDEIRDRLAAELGVNKSTLYKANGDPKTGYTDSELLAAGFTQGKNVAQSGLSKEITDNVLTRADIEAHLLSRGYDQSDIDNFDSSSIDWNDRTGLNTITSSFQNTTRTTAQKQVAADLDTKGWTAASNTDIAEVQGLDSAGRDAWIANRQFTTQQAKDALAAQGITPSNTAAYASLVTALTVNKGAAGTPATQGALVDDPEDSLIDRYITTQAEVDAEFGKYTYFDSANAGIPTGVIDDSTLAGIVQTHVGNNYVVAEDARVELDKIVGVDAYEVDNNGEYVITDNQLLGLGLAGQYTPADLASRVDAATVTEAEVRAAYGGYTPSQTEIDQFMGLNPQADLQGAVDTAQQANYDSLVGNVTGLAETVTSLEAKLDGALALGGSIDQAISKVASDLSVTESTLRGLITANTNKFTADLQTTLATANLYTDTQISNLKVALDLAIGENAGDIAQAKEDAATSLGITKEALEKLIGDNSDALSALGLNLDGLTSRVGLNEGEIVALQEALAAAITQLGGDIDAAKIKVAQDFGISDAALQGQIDDNADDLSALGLNLDGLTSRVELNETEIAALQEALAEAIADNGTSTAEAKAAAIRAAADALGISEAALQSQIDDNYDTLSDALSGLGLSLDGLTSRVSTNEGKLADLYDLIDDLADNGGSSDEAITALQNIIGNAAVEDDLSTPDIDESSPATGLYAQSGEGINNEVTLAIDAIYGYIADMDTVDSTELDAIGAVVGKRGAEVTEDDIAAVTGIVDSYGIVPWEDAPNYADTEIKYDVNADGFIDQTDIDLLTAVQTGDYGTYGGELATDSLFATTGFYDIFDQNTYAQEQAAIETERKRQQDLDTQNDINTQIQTDINNKIALDKANAEKAEYDDLMQQVQAMSQVSVETPQELANIEYMYDVYGDSPFANDQQRGLYQSPYARAKQDEMATQQQLPLRAAAEGGLIEDETDELMKLLGI
jgi:hypothetical protein